MGMIKCLNCGNDITMISSSSCANCGISLSHVKISFLAYVGTEDSLSGYQRSYKLVLLKSIYEEYFLHGNASVNAVVARFKQYYLNRYEHGVPIDKNVDERIQNIVDATPEDVFDVIKANPYNAINKQNYLKITSQDGIEYFTLQHGLDSFTAVEITNLLQLLQKKLILYYNKIGSYALEDEIDCSEQESNIEEKTQTSDMDITKLAYPTLEELGLSTRSYNAIRRHRITDFAQLLHTIENGELTKIRNLGNQSVAEILSIVEKVCNGAFVPSAPTARKLDFDNLEGLNDNAGGAIGNVQALENLGLSNRSYNALVRNGIIDFDGLVKAIDSGAIYDIRNLGRQSIEEILTVTKRTLQERVGVGNAGGIRTFDCIHPSNSELNVRVFRMFGINRNISQKLTELGIDTLGKLSLVPKAEIAQQLGIQYYKALEEVVGQFSKPLIDIVLGILNDLVSTKEYAVYLSRASGASLQEVGDKLGITRERVRQVCSKFERKIKHLMLSIAQSLEDTNGDHFVREEQILSVFDNDDYDKIFVYSLGESTEYEKIAGIYFNKEYYPRAEYDLTGIVSDIVGEGINLFEEIERIETRLDSAGYAFINADDFLNLVIEFNYKFYGDYIVRSKKSYVFLCAKIVEKFFVDGITNSDEDIARLKLLTEQEYGKLDIPENDRSLWTRLTEALVQCGRSKYIAPSRVCVDQSLLDDIIRYIDETPLKEIFFKEIYSEFEGILMMTTNIDNPQFLHGILAYYYSNKYTFSRDSVVKNNSMETIDLSGRIRSIIATSGKPISKNELSAKLPGFNETVLFNAIFNSDTVIQWEYNYYNCIDNIHLSDDDVFELRRGLQKTLEEHQGYCSEVMLYQAVADSLEKALKDNYVENPQNLFYLSSILFGNEYDFRRPHVAIKGRFKTLNTKDIIMDLIGSPDNLSFTNYMDFTQELMIPIVTAGMVFAEIEKDYCRVDQNDYLRNSCVCVDTDDIAAVGALINEYAESSWYVPLHRFSDNEERISSGLLLNEFFVESFVNMYDLGWKVIQPKTKDRRYQKGILVKTEMQVFDYAELVARVLLEQGITTLTESQLLSFMQIHQLTYKVIPKELYDSGRFALDDEGIITIS